MNGWLLDVNALLACGWKSHADHVSLFDWLNQSGKWATCPITELGFVRISMSPAYSASFENARRSLLSLRAIAGHRFIVDEIDAGDLPVVRTARETTDAHLVVLAKRHGMKLATLDQGLIASAWAAGIAENPLLSLGQHS